MQTLLKTLFLISLGFVTISNTFALNSGLSSCLQIGETYDSIQFPEFSSDGESFVFRIREREDTKNATVNGGEIYNIVKDGKKVVENGMAESPTFSPDGKHFAYIVYSGGMRIAIKDNKQIGGEYNMISSLEFSRDNNHFAFIADTRGGGNSTKYFIIDGSGFIISTGGTCSRGLHAGLNGMFLLGINCGNTKRQLLLMGSGGVEKQYDETFAPIAIAPDNTFVYKRKINGKEIAIRNGKQLGKKYEKISSFIFSPDGKSYAIEAKKNNKFIVIKDGKQIGGSYDWVNQLSFSPNSKDIFFHAQKNNKRIIIKNGEEIGTEYDNVYAPRASFVSSNAYIFAFIGEKSGKQSVITYHTNMMQKVTIGWHKRIYEFFLSPAGRHLTFATDDGVYLDFNHIGKQYDITHSPVFSPNGEEIVFVARKKDKSFVMKCKIR